MLFKKNVIFSLIIGVLISGITFYLAFRNVPFAQLADYIKTIDFFWIFPSAAIIIPSFMLRALRWQILVSSSHKINFQSAFHPLMIGFMINCILPARAGELARPLILQKNNQVPFSTGLATVAAERVFDIILLLALFGLVLGKINIAPDFEIKFDQFHLSRETLDLIVKGMVKLSIVMIMGIAALSIAKIREIINTCLLFLPGLLFFLKKEKREKIKQKLSAFLTSFTGNFAAGFSLLKSPGKIIICMGLSVLIWGLSASSYYIFSLGCPGIDLSFSEMSAVMILICFFIALPSVPGYWGLWEAGGVFAMSLFGVFQKDAAGFTLVNHAVQVFPVIGAGFFSAMIAGINIFNISYKKLASEV